MKFVCGLAQQENEYVINGVKYTVGSSFQSAKIPTSPSITDRFKRVLKSDFIPLTMNFMPTKMNADDVCSAAGKED